MSKASNAKAEIFAEKLRVAGYEARVLPAGRSTMIFVGSAYPFTVVDIPARGAPHAEGEKAKEVLMVIAAPGQVVRHRSR